MSATASTVPPTASVTARRRWPVWLVSMSAAAVAAVATEIYGLAARAFGVPMAAGSVGADSAVPINVGAFATAILIWGLVGTVLAVLLARFASRPARAYVRITIVLTVLSLAGPLAAGATAASTKLMLAVAHLVAAAIVIPVVARRLFR